jgi:hypothetical protein
MHAHRLALVAAALALFTPALARAEGRMQPGLWQVTATVALPGMDSPAPTTQTECLSEADVEKDPTPGIEKGACRVTDLVRSGDTVTWKLDCGPAGQGTGEVVYRSSTAYEGWMTLRTGEVTVKTTIRAERVGGC